MICKNCGGEYDEKLAGCPYCGGENEELARKEQREYVASYKKKIDQLEEEVPREMAKKAGNKAVKGALFVLVLCLLLFVMIWMGSRIRAERALSVQKEQLTRLEEYYQAGEYDNMSEYLDKIEKYGSSFQKYYEVKWIYDGLEENLEYMEENKNLMLEYIEQRKGDAEDYLEQAAGFLDWDITHTFWQLHKISEMEKKEFPYGNEQGILDLKERYTNALKEILMLTDEEIEEGAQRFVDIDTDYMDLALTAAERLKGQNVIQKQ